MKLCNKVKIYGELSINFRVWLKYYRWVKHFKMKSLFVELYKKMYKMKARKEQVSSVVLITRGILHFAKCTKFSVRAQIVIK